MIVLTLDELVTLLAYLKTIQNVVQEYAGEMDTEESTYIAIVELKKISHMIEQTEELLKGKLRS